MVKSYFSDIKHYFCLFHTLFFGIGLLSSPHTLVSMRLGRRFKLYFLNKGSIYIYYLKFSCKKDASLSPHFLIYSIIYINSESYMFIYALAYNTILLYLFCYTNWSSLTFDGISGWFLCPFVKSPYFLFLKMSLCWVLQDYPGSSIFSLFQPFSQSFTQGSLVLVFFRECYLFVYFYNEFLYSVLELFLTAQVENQSSKFNIIKISFCSISHDLSPLLIKLDLESRRWY